MSYLGTWQIDDYLTFAVNTHAADTGAATDADAVPSYRIYEDETGTAIITGSMAKLDDTNTTGFYSERVQLTSASGFEVGKSYTVYISAAVSSTTGTTHHTFQIEDFLDLADAVLSRAGSNVEGSASFNSLSGVIAFLTNKRAVNSNTLTVYKSDGTTTYDTFTLTTDASQPPITAATP